MERDVNWIFKNTTMIIASELNTILEQATCKPSIRSKKYFYNLTKLIQCVCFPINGCTLLIK